MDSLMRNIQVSLKQLLICRLSSGFVLLDDFIQHKLAGFGDNQDAIMKQIKLKFIFMAFV
jgi:deoxyribodipyrimidine photolyase-like uncharacterized protein